MTWNVVCLVYLVAMVALAYPTRPREQCNMPHHYGSHIPSFPVSCARTSDWEVRQPRPGKPAAGASDGEGRYPG